MIKKTEGHKISTRDENVTENSYLTENRVCAENPNCISSLTNETNFPSNYFSENDCFTANPNLPGSCELSTINILAGKSHFQRKLQFDLGQISPETTERRSVIRILPELLLFGIKSRLTECIHRTWSVNVV